MNRSGESTPEVMLLEDHVLGPGAFTHGSIMQSKIIEAL